MSLVLTLGVLVVLSATTVVAVDYSTQNSKTASYANSRQSARSLAEAGLNNALAVLNNPSNNAMQQPTLPSTEATANTATYAPGTSKWWGVLSGNTWTLYGLGLVRNPTGPGTSTVRRLLTTKVTVISSLTQPLNAQAWNYLYAKNTGQPCDLTLSNSVAIDTSMFVEGNLCLDNNASIVKAAAPDVTNLVVKGNLTLIKNVNNVGTSANPINEAHIGGWCKWESNPAHSAPCSSADNVWATGYHGPTTPVIVPPSADFTSWYSAAKPGPLNSCTTSSNFPSTAFDNDTTRNNSAAEFNLVPSSSYTCEFWESGALLGRLNWNSSTRTLTIAGVVFFDGSVIVDNNATNTYVGQGTLYVSGKFTVASSQLCGAVSGDSCNFSGWDPNTTMLAVVADGPGDSVALQNSARFQGAVYGTNTVHIENFAQTDGPLVGGTFILENNIQVHEFPTITSVPIGMPGNPNVYAQPLPPGQFSG